MHVYPLAPPHDASTEGIMSPEGAATGAFMAPAPHEPNPGWQPAAQYTGVEPHQPFWLQQSPNCESWHVVPAAAPHLASRLTFMTGAAGDVGCCAGGGRFTGEPRCGP